VWTARVELVYRLQDGWINRSQSGEVTWGPIYKISYVSLMIKSKKGKVFPYSLPSVGPGADPGVQAVSPQVT